MDFYCAAKWPNIDIQKNKGGSAAKEGLFMRFVTSAGIVELSDVYT